ncbi:MAG: hypothetical protein FJ090_15500 [Deltaproteobacteria bacterium]|nr:hypothetical protein [Deltaproteobacteria bacterium]
MSATRRDLLVRASATGLLLACEPPSPGGKDTAPTDTGDPDSGTADTANPDTAAGDTADSPDTGDIGECQSWGEPDPACEPTPPVGEGPYFREDAPERQQLNVRGESGYELRLELRLLDETCVPVEGAVIHIWHCDQTGIYAMDDAEFHCRGKATTGPDGGVCFETLRPPPYTDGADGFNPAHYHISWFVDGVQTYTTQLYFEGDPWLTEVHAEELITTPEDDGSGNRGMVRFTFVLGSLPPPE